MQGLASRKRLGKPSFRLGTVDKREMMETLNHHLIPVMIDNNAAVISANREGLLALAGQLKLRMGAFVELCTNGKSLSIDLTTLSLAAAASAHLRHQQLTPILHNNHFSLNI